MKRAIAICHRAIVESAFLFSSDLQETTRVTHHDCPRQGSIASGVLRGQTNVVQDANLRLMKVRGSKQGGFGPLHTPYESPTKSVTSAQAAKCGFELLQIDCCDARALTAVARFLKTESTSYARQLSRTAAEPHEAR